MNRGGDEPGTLVSVRRSSWFDKGQLTVRLAVPSSTSGPSLLRRDKTSASLVVSAFVADPSAFAFCLVADEVDFGVARGVLRWAGDEDDAAVGCLPKKLNRVA